MIFLSNACQTAILQKFCYQLRMGGRFPRRKGFSVAATAVVLAVAYCFGDKSLDIGEGIR